MKHLKYTLALLLCSSILAQTLAPQAQAISISEAFATPAPSSSSSRSSTINEATGKGKGVSYMENQLAWHGMAPNDEQYALAMKELEEGI